jgi:isopenicillin N synthase-like dioxygenase
VGAAPARLSIVYFTGPHPDTLVSPLPTPLCGGTPRYPAVTAAEHVQMKISAAAVQGAS